MGNMPVYVVDPGEDFELPGYSGQYRVGTQTVLHIFPPKVATFTNDTENPLCVVWIGIGNENAEPYLICDNGQRIVDESSVRVENKGFGVEWSKYFKVFELPGSARPERFGYEDMIFDCICVSRERRLRDYVFSDDSLKHLKPDPDK